MPYILDFLKRRRKPRIRARHLAAMRNDEVRRAILSEPRYSEPRRLNVHGYKMFSQGDEDGILAEIFRRIGIGGRRFCEIGVGDGRENNTLALLYDGWSGVWIEGSKRRVRAIRNMFGWAIEAGCLDLVEAYIGPGNAAQLIGNDALDLFSIDIDGIDWHVVKALPLKARVVVVEYNAKFRPPIDFVVRLSDDFRWQRDDYFSASLNAWERLMRQKGYALVGCGLTGGNAFFVRDDLARETLFCAPFTAENHYEPPRYWLVSGWEAGHATSGRGPDGFA